MLDELKTRDRLEIKKFNDKTVYVHDDHRFVIPLIFDAIRKGDLVAPFKWVMLDAHHDLADVSDESKALLNELRHQDVVDEELLMEVVTNSLRGDDADWLKALMELGWVSDVFVFGIRHDLDYEENPFEYIDSDGDVHTVHHVGSFPTDFFSHHGMMNDIARRHELQQLWRFLDWDTTGRQYGFKESDGSMVLNFDLDCFTIHYDEFLFPWNDEIWQQRFMKESNESNTIGWSGVKFINELAAKAGVIAIAREPDYCGGEENMQQIYSDVNQRLFDNRIN